MSISLLVTIITSKGVLYNSRLYNWTDRVSILLLVTITSHMRIRQKPIVALWAQRMHIMVQSRLLHIVSIGSCSPCYVDPGLLVLVHCWWGHDREGWNISHAKIWTTMYNMQVDKTWLVARPSTLWAYVKGPFGQEHIGQAFALGYDERDQSSWGSCLLHRLRSIRVL